MLRLNSQARQYAGFTPARRVAGRAPEIPIGKVGNPFYNDFANPTYPPATQANQVIAKLRGGPEILFAK